MADTTNNVNGDVRNLVDLLSQQLKMQNQRPKFDQPAPIGIKFDGSNIKEWLFEIKLWAMECNCEELLETYQWIVGKESEIKIVKAKILRSMDMNIAMLVAKYRLPAKIIDELKMRFGYYR